MISENYQFQFHRCTALKVSGIFHKITGNQSENRLFIQATFNMMDDVFVEVEHCFCTGISFYERFYDGIRQF